jgi:prepilin-type N-terminal cleavage/methylation domain-containing protein
MEPRGALVSNKGFTLLEIIFAVLLLAIAIVPLLNAYAPALFSTAAEEERAVFTNRARATLNRVAALEFSRLNDNQGNPVDLATLFGSADEAAKETFALKGTSYTPAVAITDQSGGDGGLLQLEVTINYVSLKTLKAEY